MTLFEQNRDRVLARIPNMRKLPDDHAIVLLIDDTKTRLISYPNAKGFYTAAGKIELIKRWALRGLRAFMLVPVRDVEAGFKATNCKEGFELVNFEPSEVP